MAGKRRKIGGEKSPDIGMVMTVSLFLILLTFFILLNSIAVIDERRVRLTLGSLVGAFGGLDSGTSPIKTGEVLLPPAAPMQLRDFDLSRMLSLVDRSRVLGEIKVHPVSGGHRLSISARDLFGPDGATLLPAAADLLDHLAGLLKSGGYPLDIVGHTDRIGEDETADRANFADTALMAARVHAHLVDSGKIEAQRVTSYGAGSRRPAASGESPESRMQNRRVDIVVKHRLPAYVERILSPKPSGVITYKEFTFEVF